MEVYGRPSPVRAGGVEGREEVGSLFPSLFLCGSSGRPQAETGASPPQPVLPPAFQDAAAGAVEAAAAP